MDLDRCILRIFSTESPPGWLEVLFFSATSYPNSSCQGLFGPPLAGLVVFLSKFNNFLILELGAGFHFRLEIGHLSLRAQTPSKIRWFFQMRFDMTVINRAVLKVMFLRWPALSKEEIGAVLPKVTIRLYRFFLGGSDT